MPRKPSKKSGKALLPATVVPVGLLGLIDEIVVARAAVYKTWRPTTRTEIVRELLLIGLGAKNSDIENAYLEGERLVNEWKPAGKAKERS